MTGITKAWAYLSATDLLAKKYDLANAKLRTAEDNILDKIHQTDPKNADVLEKRLNDNKQVIAQLRSSRANEAQSRKAAAAEKVKRIKAEMQMLKTMGGDPKIVAKQIARLARELAAAAREYASAIGTTSPDQTVSSDVATNASGNNVAALNTVASGTTDSGTAVSAGVSVMSVSGEASALEEKDKKVEDATQEHVSASTTTTGETLAESSRQYQEMQRQKFKDDLQREVANIKEKSSEAEADRKFVGEVRILAAQLKALAKLMKQRLHQAGDHSADQNFDRTNQALAEVEKSISDITGNNMTSISALT
jgi:hypothetical protein